VNNFFPCAGRGRKVVSSPLSPDFKAPGKSGNGAQKALSPYNGKGWELCLITVHSREMDAGAE